jgi:ATP-dependent helicase/nuclease subunit B
MRKQLGLPLDERRIGLSAHDFCQALAAPVVYLTRSIRVEGTPTKPARWLLRMETVLAASKLTLTHNPEQWRQWFKLLDTPEKLVPVPRPAPKPPLVARPRSLYVTAIEAWMRDPYGFYAKHILKLRALDPIDADRGPADYGTLVHEVLEKFLLDHPGSLPPNALEIFLDHGKQAFGQILEHPDEWAFWWPRFESIARWVIAQESERRPLIRQSRYEIEGQVTIQGPAGAFTLKARADRLDQMRDGSVAIIDYKTGKPPSQTEIAAGYAPQLPLEAAIAGRGGFADIPASAVSQLLFWHLKGGEDGGKEVTAGSDPIQLAQAALEGVAGLIAAFDDPNTPYEARPYPAMAPKYSDYGHLARIAEWSTDAEEGGDT